MYNTYMMFVFFMNNGEYAWKEKKADKLRSSAVKPQLVFLGIYV